MKIFTILKNKIPVIISIVIIIFTWKIVFEILDAEIILPSPESTLGSVFTLITSKTFFITVLATVARALLGFLLSCILGLAVGILTGINNFIERAIDPILIAIRSTPVISVIILALIWLKTDMVPVFVSFLIAFPIICANVCEGIKSVDKKRLEMAQIYRVKKWRILAEIYLPSIFSYFVAGISTAMGIGWKAVITAEALSQPIFAIGTSLYTSKIYIETDYVFAWIVIIICLSFVFERAIRLFEKKVVKWRSYSDSKNQEFVQKL